MKAKTGNPVKEKAAADPVIEKQIKDMVADKKKSLVESAEKRAARTDDTIKTKLDKFEQGLRDGKSARLKKMEIKLKLSEINARLKTLRDAKKELKAALRELSPRRQRRAAAG